MPSSAASGRPSRYIEEVGNLGFHPLEPAEGHGFLAQVDAARRHSGLAHHFQEFAAPAAEIQYVPAVLEIRQVDLLAGFDVILGASEALGEAAVIEG